MFPTNTKVKINAILSTLAKNRIKTTGVVVGHEFTYQARPRYLIKLDDEKILSCNPAVFWEDEVTEIK